MADLPDDWLSNKRKGEQRANEACAKGFADLNASIEDAPEWKLTTHLGAYRPVYVPNRAMLEGMRDHIQKSFKAPDE